MTEAEIRALLGGRPAAGLYSWKSPTKKEIGRDPRAASDSELVALMAAHVNLMRRPVLAVGRALLIQPDEAAIAALAKRR